MNRGGRIPLNRDRYRKLRATGTQGRFRLRLDLRSILSPPLPAPLCIRANSRLVDDETS